MDAQILVVDDEPLIRRSAQATLARDGYSVDIAGSGTEALEKLAAQRPDVVVLDILLGDMNGLDLLKRLRADAPEIKALVITAQGSVENAVAAMRLGAYDFLTKPFDLEELKAAVRNALRTSSLEQRVEYFADRERRGEPPMIAASTAMQKVLAEASIVAANDVPVALILGETGTGKQLLARLLHDRSAVRSGPFVELNCSTIPENLVESELFGHERGAFSDAHARKPGLVEIADGGTLFLDEIGDLGLGAQAKLLTFLEQRTFRRVGGTSTRRVSVRVVAATNRSLQQMVAERTFREDLWYRLAGMALRLAPLRERSDDVEPLVRACLEESNRSYRRSWRDVAPDALALLRRYRWPGNVRELRAVIQRAALMNQGDVLLATHLPSELIEAALTEPEPGAEAASAELAPGGIPTLAEMEVVHIRRVLALCGGNKTVAAQKLGISRQTLAKKLGSAD